MKYMVLLAAACFTQVTIFSQSVIDSDTVQTKANYDNVHLKKLHSSSEASSFLIWVKKEVPPHYHENHTEHVYVIEGNGIMLLNDEIFRIKPGDIIVLPPGTIHAVEQTGETPLKVVSVQSPEFIGEDRVTAESPVWPVKGQK